MIDLNIIFNSQIMFMLTKLLVAATGGFIFIKLKISAGAILGAMFFAIIVSIVSEEFSVPEIMVITSRIIAGTLIGCRVSRTSILSLKRVFFPMLFFTFFMLSLSMCSGFIIHKLTGIHKATAFFGRLPAS